MGLYHPEREIRLIPTNLAPSWAFLELFQIGEFPPVVSDRAGEPTAALLVSRILQARGKGLPGSRGFYADDRKTVQSVSLALLPIGSE